MSSPSIRPLLDDEYAPITSGIGFIHLPLEAAAEAVAAWWRSIVPPVSVERLSDPFPASLCRLTPLDLGSRSRQLLVDQGDWTACFDSSARGTDPTSTLVALCQLNRCDGVAVIAVPDSSARDGGLQFHMFGPDRTRFLNYVRTVSIVRESGRWTFDSSGEPQTFEEIEAYDRPRVADRLTVDMISRYCLALGFSPFEAAAYGTAILVTGSPEATPAHLSLRDRQMSLGIDASPCRE